MPWNLIATYLLRYAYTYKHVYMDTDGIPQVIKAVVESIDLINLSITFKAIEGDVLDVYNNFKIIYKLTPHILSGSVVHVIIEYGKPSDDTPDPTSLMEEVIQVSKNVDAYAGNLI